jgi:hypothetical protein
MPELEELLTCEMQGTQRHYQLRRMSEGGEEVLVREHLSDRDSTVEHHAFRDAGERESWLEAEKLLLRAQGWHF